MLIIINNLFKNAAIKSYEVETCANDAPWQIIAIDKNIKLAMCVFY